MARGTVVNNPGLVALIYAVGGIVFLGGFAIGFVSTGRRVLYYLVHGAPRPRLLTRDAIVWGGLSLSFAQIAVVRFLPPEARVALTQGNVLWALTTTIPALVAVVAYCYFELVVIERGPK